MAEAFVNHTCGDEFEAQSAGLAPGTLNPLVVEVMAELGIDISHKGTQCAADLAESGAIFDYVVTVCDESSARTCPVFPGPAERLHWTFPDPSALRGTKTEKLGAVRKIRDQIRARVEMWCEEVCAKTEAI